MIEDVLSREQTRVSTFGDVTLLLASDGPHNTVLAQVWVVEYSDFRVTSADKDLVQLVMPLEGDHTIL